MEARPRTFRISTGDRVGAGLSALAVAAFAIVVAAAAWLGRPPSDQGTRGAAWLDLSRGPATVDDSTAVARASAAPIDRIHYRIGPRWIVGVSDPTLPFELVVAPDLFVAGNAEPWIHHLAVRLLANDGRVLAMAIAESRPSNEPGASDRRTFSVPLSLPSPRPSGTVYVEVFPVDSMPVPDRYRVRVPVNMALVTP